MQAARPPGNPHPATALLGGRPVSLADWYGDPLSSAGAGALLREAERALHTRLRRGGSCFPLHLLQLICRHWLGADAGLYYRQLAATIADSRETALLELSYGQLLISRRLRRAMAHLEKGFGLAVHQLGAAEYFRVVRRHEALGCLRLGDAPYPPQPLDSLLVEAAVIRCLRGKTLHRTDHAQHRDTLG